MTNYKLKLQAIKFNSSRTWPNTHSLTKIEIQRGVYKGLHLAHKLSSQFPIHVKFNLMESIKYS